MKYNRLGSTPLVVSELGFGAFAIGGNKSGNSYGPTDDATSMSAIGAALDRGCNFFDTADVYGYGHSEELLGRALREARALNDVVIASKVGGNFESGRTVIDFSRTHINRAIEGTLRRLGRAYLDLYQLHNPPLAIIESGEVFDVLDELRQSGKIRCYGVSIHTVAEGLACLRDGRPQSLQLVYNLFALLDPELSTEALFEPSREQGVGLIAREPLAAGFLSGRHTLETEYGPGDNRKNWAPDRRRMFVALANSLRRMERSGVSLTRAALRFVIDQSAIATTIVGVKTPEQVSENWSACSVPSFAELEEATAHL